MGRFIYEDSARTEIEDRALAHLQTVIVTKLRRGESFSFSFKDETAVAVGRTTVWIHPSSTLVFKFYGSRPPKLNPQWLESLAFVANSSQGLHLAPEPAPGSQIPGRSDPDAELTVFTEHDDDPWAQRQGVERRAHASE